MTDTSIQYREWVGRTAGAMLAKLVGSEEGQRVAARFELAFGAAERASQGSRTPLSAVPASETARALVLCLLADLLPGGHHPEVWLLPRGGKGGPTLNCWIAPAGYRKLARRAGVHLQEIPVWAGEEQAVQAALTAYAQTGIYIPPPANIERSIDDLVGFYLLVRDPQTGTRVEFLSQADVLKRRGKSDSYSRGGGPWVDWPVEMARKTALRWAFARGLVVMDRRTAEAVHLDGAQDAQPAPTTRAQVRAQMAEGFLPAPAEAAPDWLVELRQYRDSDPIAWDAMIGGSPDDLDEQQALEALAALRDDLGPVGGAS